MRYGARIALLTLVHLQSLVQGTHQQAGLPTAVQVREPHAPEAKEKQQHLLVTVRSPTCQASSVDTGAQRQSARTGRGWGGDSVWSAQRAQAPPHKKSVTFPHTRTGCMSSRSPRGRATHATKGNLGQRTQQQAHHAQSTSVNDGNRMPGRHQQAAGQALPPLPTWVFRVWNNRTRGSWHCTGTSTGTCPCGWCAHFNDILVRLQKHGEGTGAGTCRRQNHRYGRLACWLTWCATVFKNATRALPGKAGLASCSGAGPACPKHMHKLELA